AAVDARGGAVRLGRADGVVLADLDAALLEERAQGLAEVGVAVRGDVQLARQGLGLERRVGLARQVREDLLGETGHLASFSRPGGIPLPTGRFACAPPETILLACGPGQGVPLRSAGGAG